MKLEDTDGNELEVGDKVAFISKQLKEDYVNAYLCVGVITKIKNKSVWISSEKITKEVRRHHNNVVKVS